MKKFISSVTGDITASIVVFLVALPLCLGIAQASNPSSAPNSIPLFAGIIAGVIGGIVVGIFSGSSLSVSGPAAGLTATVSASIITLGGNVNAYEIFLLSVVLAGVLQVILGFAKAGIIGDYIPNSVIKGMLAAIGLLLILKQVPHLVGEDTDPEGDETFIQPNHKNTFTGVYYAFKFLTPTVALLGAVSLALMFLWETKFFKSKTIFQAIPGALVVVVLGTVVNEFFLSKSATPLQPNHLVNLPKSKDELLSSFKHPNFINLTNPNVWICAVTLAIVASLETLLGIEAVDKLDSLKRITPPNQELKAQGLGNIVSGLMGGLPVTSVIVRSSANVNAGAKTKLSTILHGVLLLLMVTFFAGILNKIPLASLAAILIATGYKLARVSLFKEFYKKGLDQFIPFIITILAILLTDLLKGISVGILAGLFFLVRSNFKSSVVIVNDNNNYLIRLRKDVSFLNKPIIKHKLNKVAENAFVVIDITRADFIDKDVIEEINNFIIHAHLKQIKVEVKKSITKSIHTLFIDQHVTA